MPPGGSLKFKAIISNYESKLSSHQITIKYEQANLIPQIRKYAVIVQTDYEETCISLDLRLPPGGKKQVEKLLKEYQSSRKKLG